MSEDEKDENPLQTDEVTDAGDPADLPVPTGDKKPKKPRPGPDFSQRQPGGEYPLVTDLLSTTITDLTDDLGTYAVGGVGYWLATIVLTFISIPVLYLVMFGGMFGGAFAGIGIGAAVGSEELGAVLSMLFMFGALFVVMFGFIGVFTAMIMPMTGSMYRAVRSHQLGEEKLDFSAPFSTVTVGAVSIVGAGLLAAMGGMVGIMFLYIGALVSHAFLHLMVPAVAFHGVSPIKGAKMSINCMLKNPSWALGFWGIGLVIAMIGGYVPVLGSMVYFAFVTKGYRAVFGDGDEPYEA